MAEHDPAAPMIAFVCTGNICRSPLAEALARHHAGLAGLAAQVRFESFGTHDYHVGQGADPRTVATARRFGIDLSGHRARQVDAGHCQRARRVFAMDAGHHRHLHRLAPSLRGRIEPYLPWLGLAGDDVPDPYYGDADGFVAVHRLLDEASRRLVERLPGLLSGADD